MSKLADRIRNAGRPEATPMGFGAGASGKPTPTMLCLVRLSTGDADKAAAASAQGADAVIFEGIEATKLQERAQETDQLSLGVRLGKAERSAVATQRQAGVDFVVLDPQSASAEALQEEGIGLVLALGRDAPDTTLRLLGDLPLDALLLPTPDIPLTVGRLLELRRISVLSRTPLLMEIPAGVEASQLQALREGGVAGVIIEGKALDRLPALRETIASLPRRGRRREEHPEAILPAAALAEAPAEEEEEEFP